MMIISVLSPKKRQIWVLLGLYPQIADRLPGVKTNFFDMGGAISYGICPIFQLFALNYMLSYAELYAQFVMFHGNVPRK